MSKAGAALGGSIRIRDGVILPSIPDFLTRLHCRCTECPVARRPDNYQRNPLSDNILTSPSTNRLTNPKRYVTMLTNKVMNGGDHPGREPAEGRQKIATLAGKDYGASGRGFVAAKSKAATTDDFSISKWGRRFSWVLYLTYSVKLVMMVPASARSQSKPKIIQGAENSSGPRVIQFDRSGGLM